VEKYFVSYFSTNLKNKARMALFEKLALLDVDKISMQGVGGTKRVVTGQTLLFPSYDGTLIKEIVRQTLVGLTRKSDNTNEGRTFTVEVLNGTETAGLAARTAELIGSFGYDVINVGNADNALYDKTLIINRAGATGEINYFSQIIRCKNVRDDTPDESDAAFGENGFSAINNDIEQMYRITPDFTLIRGKDINGRYTN
jgi:hypothetical protein